MNDLKTQNIRHNPERELCPHCEELNELNKRTTPLLPSEHEIKTRLERHQTIAKQQSLYYTTMRSNITEKQIICVMDFSLFQIANNNHQDLIITLINNKPPKQEEKERKREKKTTKLNPSITSPKLKYPQQPIYYHFFGEGGLKNDICFVAEVFFNHLVPKLMVYDEILFWTDGGPKHFKISPLIKLIHKLSNNQLKNKKISHHFFASYHGHSICDAAAAHIKFAIEKDLNITQHAPQNIDQTCKIISSI